MLVLLVLIFRIGIAYSDYVGSLLQ